MKKYLLLSIFAVLSTLSGAQTLSTVIVSSADTITATTTVVVSDTLGIYACLPAEMVEISSVSFDGTQAAGLYRKTIKSWYAGTGSTCRLTSPVRVRFYFGAYSMYNPTKYYMFAQGNTPQDFIFVRFDVEKDCRTLSVAKASIKGVFGITQYAEAAIDVSVVREGVYEMTIDAPPGEYGFVPCLSGVPNFSVVFDFAID